MVKICEICENKFETKSYTRIYCYECSEESTRLDNQTRNTMSWKEYKAEAFKCILVCSDCHKEIHSEI